MTFRQLCSKHIFTFIQHHFYFSWPIVTSWFPIKPCVVSEWHEVAAFIPSPHPPPQLCINWFPPCLIKHLICIFKPTYMDLYCVSHVLFMMCPQNIVYRWIHIQIRIFFPGRIICCVLPVLLWTAIYGILESISLCFIMERIY